MERGVLVGLDALDRIDVVVGDEARPRRCIVVHGGEWTAEEEGLLTVQALIKFMNLEEYARLLYERDGHRTELELTTFGEPPDTLLRWLRARGVDCVLRSDDTPLAGPCRGQPARFSADAEGGPALDPLLAACARRFAGDHGLAWPPAEDALPAVDRALSQRRIEAGFEPDEPAPDLQDGDLVVLAGAYAGEVVRERYGGHWKLQKGMHTPLVLVTAGDRPYTVNPIGKARKHIEDGPDDSVAGLVGAVAHILARR
jgi:hypothetical protein